MTGAAWLALLSHWRRHPLQLMTLVAGLALATGLWSAVQAINAEARSSYQRAAELLQASAAERLEPVSEPLTLALYAELRRAGWPVTPVLSGSVSFGGQAFEIMGVDFLSHPLAAQLSLASGADGAVALDALRPPGRIFAHPETAALAASRQDRIPVSGEDSLPPDCWSPTSAWPAAC